MGSLEEAWGAATTVGWGGKAGKIQSAYTGSGFKLVMFRPGGESADFGLLGLLGKQQDINIYVVVTGDGGFAHGIALLLGQDKKVIVWIPDEGVAKNFSTLKDYYSNFSLEKLNDVLKGPRSTPKPEPVVTRNVIVTVRNAKGLLSAACLIRLEGITEWTALWGLKQLKQYSIKDISHIYLLIENELSSPSLTEFVEEIKKYPEIKVAIVNTTKRHHDQFPSEPGWTILGNPNATSCAQLLVNSYKGKLDDKIKIWAKAASSDPGQEGDELRYLAQVACTKGNEQALTFLRELVLR